MVFAYGEGDVTSHNVRRLKNTDDVAVELVYWFCHVGITGTQGERSLGIKDSQTRTEVGAQTSYKSVDSESKLVASCHALSYLFAAWPRTTTNRDHEEV